MIADNITKISYRFQDSSVPPEYQRSYEIIVTNDSVGIIVDSYGNVLAEKQYPLTGERFDDIVSLMYKCHIRKAESITEDDDCTGGTSEQLKVFNKEGEIFSGTMYHCGGNESGDVAGDLKGFADELKKMIPDFKEIVH